MPAGYDEHSYLRHLIEIGMEWRFDARLAGADPVFTERIERELNIIHSMGFRRVFPDRLGPLRICPPG